MTSEGACPIVHPVTDPRPSQDGFLSSGLSRRALIGAAGAAGLVTAAGGYRALGDGAASAATALPAPSKSGIENIVVLMMENRSFDHFLGWLPSVNSEADGRQAGLTYLDRYRVPHQTHHLDIFASCGFQDPDHSYEGGRVELNHGRCNGWLRAGQNDTLSIGYYEQADLPFLGQAVPEWTTFDRYFSAVMAETFPNRFYLHAARTDRLHNNTSQFTYPTIWSRLIAKGISNGYYYGDNIALFPALLKHHPEKISPFADFLSDAAAGALPAVTFIDPRFTNEEKGTSNDDHPHADIRAGEDFMNQVYDAVRTSPQWEKTVLVITYDEWGGFFDHVPPGHAPDVSKKTSLRGFRVPTVVISPFARRGFVSHETFDHTSILKMIEWRFGLKPLTVRDQKANNLARVLDFAHPDTSSNAYDVPPFTSQGCSTAADLEGSEYKEWPAVKQEILARGGVFGR
jgi:phospholipase C